MVVVKYKKINKGMFFSHLNMIRIWNRILAIAGVEVNYSEGFTKTRRIFFSSPTRVGVESLCEYLIIDTSEKAKNVKAKIENMLPDWLVLISCNKTNGKFNVAALNTSAKYFVTFDDYKSTKVKIKDFFNQDKIEIDIVLHGEDKVVDVKNRIISYSLEDEGFSIIAGVGANSVRIDELIRKLLVFINKPKKNFEIFKQELYANDEKSQNIEIDKLICDIIEEE